MKKEIIPSVLLSICCIVVCSILYPAVIWLVAQTAPNHGNGKIISENGTYYYQNIGQKTTIDKYFWTRPSAVDFNAAGSGGSNKAPGNPDYLADVQKRLDTFVAHHPGVNKIDIPADMITASGSGLDPDITLQGASVQISRVAKARNLPETKVKELVNNYTDKPLWGMLGPQKINVLKLNIALDKIK